MAKPDAFEDFMAREQAAASSSTGANKHNSSKQLLNLQLDESRWTLTKKASAVFHPGRRIGYLEVLGRRNCETDYGPRAAGYICKCHAPTKDGGECGQIVLISYQRLYYSQPTSCGCTPKKKHPTVSYENMRIERIEVLRWDYELMAWECLCHECARLLYRRNIREIRQLANTCRGHEVEITPPVKARYLAAR